MDVRSVFSSWHHFDVFSVFKEGTSALRTRGALRTFAANLTDLADEARRSTEFHEGMINSAGTVTTIALAVIGAAYGFGAIDKASFTWNNPMFAAPAFTGLLTVYGLWGRASSLKTAMRYEQAAALALAEASQTPAWRGCGILTALFKMLFSSDGGVERFGNKMIGGRRA